MQTAWRDRHSFEGDRGASGSHARPRVSDVGLGQRPMRQKTEPKGSYTEFKSCAHHFNSHLLQLILLQPKIETKQKPFTAVRSPSSLPSPSSLRTFTLLTAACSLPSLLSSHTTFGLQFFPPILLASSSFARTCSSSSAVASSAAAPSAASPSAAAPSATMLACFLARYARRLLELEVRTPFSALLSYPESGLSSRGGALILSSCPLYSPLGLSAILGDPGVHGWSELLGLQADASINPGNSGGPAFNEECNCVGIAFQSMKKEDAENIGYFFQHMSSYTLFKFMRGMEHTLGSQLLGLSGKRWRILTCQWE
ncbi:uncharacterized protein [Spinacia oleracea]|uniref:Peptidase S1 domain-containing protein n=1 Tax=Spinacia oleracea TaxID=3562 RepID=A0ABM3R3I7_SPIOL|nr:uncharacterized protein LOC110800093 [Spinacia oleracea]